MNVITIPKTITKGQDLVIISRKKLEFFIGLAARQAVLNDLDAGLDKELDQAIREYRSGKFFGPFKTVKEARQIVASVAKRIKK
jgi:hypothetical protein